MTLLCFLRSEKLRWISALAMPREELDLLECYGGLKSKREGEVVRSLLWMQFRRPGGNKMHLLKTARDHGSAPPNPPYTPRLGQ